MFNHVTLQNLWIYYKRHTVRQAILVKLGLEKKSSSTLENESFVDSFSRVMRGQKIILIFFFYFDPVGGAAHFPRIKP